MTHLKLESLLAEISTIDTVQSIGRVAEISHGTLVVKGLSDIASIGDRISIHAKSGALIGGEILQITEDRAIALLDGQVSGIVIGDRVFHEGPMTISPDPSWIGRVIDAAGQPMDGRPLRRGPDARSLHNAPPKATIRKTLGARLETGLSAFNTLLPLVRGQRIGLFAGSGVGKSTLLSKFAQGVEADVVVIALVGERGREVREFIENTLGPEGMARAIVVAATSDQSPIQRRQCPLTAMTIAEYFRDLGAHVLLLTDSVTRLAEAHREIALVTGEPPSLRGFPPSTTHLITSLCERSGPGLDDSGDITAVFSVLVAGSDMDEPVADILRGVLDGHIVMDRKIAERGRFPAIDLLRSVSRSLPHAASDDENILIKEARRLLGAYDQAELMIQAGLYTTGSDRAVDDAVKVWPRLDAFLAEEVQDGTSESFENLRRILSVVPNPHAKTTSVTSNALVK
ncbi:FliI/YscN family ATPase [Cochlodiniinecator piscidefendens]|uniref:FliI/YscN family ATPase n=1 Tax=Cochlodiniinecator piscidefendens TaxID=2715756 RepID=UPI00140E57A0|nr:FliI/YscN family ATPase [Cochlodiniinecator piscidefendens]